jgi:septal ring factor EnvC (AmiA/AmiB activator)
MTTPAIWNDVFKVKASRYSRAEAEAAIADCHKALKANPQASADYVTKTWCEIDAMRARIAELSTRKPLTPTERELFVMLAKLTRAARRQGGNGSLQGLADEAEELIARTGPHPI